MSASHGEIGRPHPAGLLGAAGGFAEIQHEVAVVNVSVPIRVFARAKFVDSLGLWDFEFRPQGGSGLGG